MNLYLRILPVIALGACQPNANPGNSDATANVATAATRATGTLRPGIYQVTSMEMIAGEGNNEQIETESCVTPAMAEHPDAFLASARLPGCRPGPIVRNGDEFTRDLMCTDNQRITIRAEIDDDGWEQKVVGTSLHGNYEAHEVGKRIGDC